MLLFQFLLSSGVSDPYLPWKFVKHQLNPLAIREVLLELRAEYGVRLLTVLCVQPQRAILLLTEQDVDAFVWASLGKDLTRW